MNKLIGYAGRKNLRKFQFESLVIPITASPVHCCVSCLSKYYFSFIITQPLTVRLHWIQANFQLDTSTLSKLMLHFFSLFLHARGSKAEHLF